MLQMAKNSNENILKLRELSDKICDVSPYHNLEIAIDELRFVINEGNKEIKTLTSEQKKIKTYEKIHNKITNILNKLNI